MKKLIVTADDFGRALPINEAVEDAHRRGILTAASLMMTGDGKDDAVERARRTPTLSVGLHIALVDSKPVLPPEQLPDLVEADGRFGRRLVAMGVKIFLNPSVRRQVEAEMRAQFDAYRATGLPLGHVDSHHHYHLHPTVSAILIRLAAEYGAKGVRVPWEPPLTSWRARGCRLGLRLGNGIFHFRRAQAMRAMARAAGLAVNDRVFGVNDSGSMNAACVTDFLTALPDGLSELYCHPAAGTWKDRPMPPSYHCVDEYHALIDPGVLDVVRRRDIMLTSFAREGAPTAG